jgi:hypothetical protein
MAELVEAIVIIPIEGRIFSSTFGMCVTSTLKERLIELVGVKMLNL